MAKPARSARAVPMAVAYSAIRRCRLRSSLPIRENTRRLPASSPEPGWVRLQVVQHGRSPGLVAPTGRPLGEDLGADQYHEPAIRRVRRGRSGRAPPGGCPRISGRLATGESRAASRWPRHRDHDLGQIAGQPPKTSTAHQQHPPGPGGGDLQPRRYGAVELRGRSDDGDLGWGCRCRGHHRSRRDGRGLARRCGGVRFRGGVRPPPPAPGDPRPDALGQSHPITVSR